MYANWTTLRAQIPLYVRGTEPPERNPIEGAFADLKQHLRLDHSRDPAALEAAMKAGRNAITSRDAHEYVHVRGPGYRTVSHL